MYTRKDLEAAASRAALTIHLLFSGGKKFFLYNHETKFFQATILKLKACTMLSFAKPSTIFNTSGIVGLESKL